MATYPRTQSEVSALIEAMIAGFGEHPGDFPSVDVGVLQAARDEFIAATEALVEASAAVALAAEAKAAKLERLNAIAKIQLKQSQVDTAENPQKLNYIGWGPRANSQSMLAPHQPGVLRIVSQDYCPGNDTSGSGGSKGNNNENETRGILHLRWKKSAFKRARFVRFYSVERRAACNTSGNFDIKNSNTGPVSWEFVASSLSNEIILQDEPTSVRLEYRIKAVNAGGESMPSNTVSVVL